MRRTFDTPCRRNYENQLRLHAYDHKVGRGGRNFSDKVSFYRKGSAKEPKRVTTKPKNEIAVSKTDQVARVSRSVNPLSL